MRLDPSDRRRYEGKRVTVWGLGSFGGGAAAARFFVEAGARVTVIDRKPDDQLAESLAVLEGLPIRYGLGREHEADELLGADLVVQNPAIPPSSPWVRALEEAGTPTTSEVVLGLERLRAPCALVTGTKGKTTTTALLGEIAAVQHAGGRVVVAGNNERSLLEAVSADPPPVLAVIEVSSFMADALARAVRGGLALERPRVVALTSLGPEHLNWHGTLEAYYEAKLSLLDLDPRAVVLPAREEELRRRVPLRLGREPLLTGRVLEAASGRPAVTVRDGRAVEVGADGADTELFALETLSLLGEHNLENALVAAAAARACGASPGDVAAAVASFRPLAHRLETVATSASGVRFINDSTATTPVAALAALRAVSGPVVLMAGGSEKGADYEELGRAAARAHCVVCYGQVGGKIAARVAEAVARGEGSAEVADVSSRAGSFEDAFAEGLRRCPPGGALLLAPAAASYDMFRSFKQRGERFRELARAACS